MSGPERLKPEQLRTLFLFEALNDDQLGWLAERGRVVEYPSGATIHAEGAPASCFLVLLSGTLVMSKRVQGGELELFRTDYYGAYTGAFNAYVPDRGVPKVYLSTARAVTDCRLFEIPASDFGQAVWKWFPMAAHLLEGAATQGADASAIVEQHERLVALGSVTAGLTHELNNPVAAVMSASARLREMLAEMREKLGLVVRSQLPGPQLEAIADLAARALEHRRNAPTLSPLEASDREAELIDWLEDHGVDAAWEIAPTLVAAGVDQSWLESFAEALPQPHLGSGLSYPVRALESDSLLDEITDAAGRISALLASAKQYTQMDRAPLQTFDVHEGLDATLTMLGHKLGDGIEVVRDYDRSLPQIAAFPGELNQVWTNLIDNAVDAMKGQGMLTIRTRPDGDDRLMVEIGDTGPGVPDDVRSRIFEPFFTTKPMGKGTGLGLDIAWRIVVGRHHGDIRLESEPGDTRFQVRLPLRELDVPQG
ncbi:MAG TPA: ATP-binding protein [Acidimicrobiales bacterium]|jgi:signal transduction histidine kinase|nr:ATP-binding protein [Acidimicrobiales bacterium]